MSLVRTILSTVALACFAAGDLRAQFIYTFAGGRNDEGRNVQVAAIGPPFDVTVDAAGNVYIADRENNRIRKIEVATGIFTTVAGSGSRGFSGDDGPATSASLAAPAGVSVDSGGNLYIADQFNQRIRRVDATTRIITTIAGNGTSGFSGDGGAATSAQLSGPFGVRVDSAGNIYILDANNRVRNVGAVSRIITTIAGNGTRGAMGDGGPATAAQLNSPQDISISSTGDVYLADTSNNSIRKIAAATGIITTVAGTGTAGSTGDGGPASAAALSFPVGITVDSSGNLFIADTGNNKIRKVDAATQIISTIAGSGNAGFTGDGGPAVNAALQNPFITAVDGAGNAYVADYRNFRIRRIDAATKVITTFCGGPIGDDELATAAQILAPATVAVDAAGNVYIADVLDAAIRRVDAVTRIVTTVAGGNPNGVAPNGGPATSTALNFPIGVAVDSTRTVYFSDIVYSRIFKIDATTKNLVVVAGTGSGGSSGDGGLATAAALSQPNAIAFDTSGNLFYADSGSSRIRRIDRVTGVITTVAGNGTPGFSGDSGPAIAAMLRNPRGVAVDAAGNLYIADTANNRVRRVDAATGAIATIAGSDSTLLGDGGPATAAGLFGPYGVAVDAAGNILIAEAGRHCIRRVDATTKVITTLAGNGTPGFSGNGGAATAAALNFPTAVAIDASGNIYIADSINNRIRILTTHPPRRRAVRR